MQRSSITPRSDWKRTAERHGFHFHSIGGQPYWDESAAYFFALAQIERDLEDPAAELEQMCLEIVDRTLRDEAALERLAIPCAYWDYIAGSWRTGEKNLYGRMDFAYDGRSPAKLYEYNADTPTSLYESAVFQWVWLEEARERGLIPKGCDQLNSLHERLVDAFRHFGIEGTLHLASVRGHSEDRGTIAYIADCASQAGLATSLLDIEDIGIATSGQFTDADDVGISTLFKLYPWEWLLREDFARHIPGAGCRFIEPAWKSVLSNKGLLALLWERFAGHPNLLPAFFEGDPRAESLGSRFVRKPLYSREGANVEIHDRRWRQDIHLSPGPYGAEGHVVQAYHPLPDFGGRYPLCGIWIVASEVAGLGLREDGGLVTSNGARFVPHVING
jgi:glutathionylspermidine synthase